MSWKPEVYVQGAWSRNGLVFATQQEAWDNARALEAKWFLVDNVRAVESTEPVNYQWRDGALVPVPQGVQP